MVLINKVLTESKEVGLVFWFFHPVSFLARGKELSNSFTFFVLSLPGIDKDKILLSHLIGCCQCGLLVKGIITLIKKILNGWESIIIRNAFIDFIFT